jgi:hypothetical protein
VCIIRVQKEENREYILYTIRVYVCVETHFVSFRNSQIELRSSTVRRSNKNLRLDARAWGLLRATKQSAFFVAKTFLIFFPLAFSHRQSTLACAILAIVSSSSRHLSFSLLKYTHTNAHTEYVYPREYIRKIGCRRSVENKSIETLNPSRALAARTLHASDESVGEKRTPLRYT